MKTALLLSLLALLAGIPAAFGQGEASGEIKETIKIRPDHSKSTTIVDPDARTAEETITDAKDKVTKKTTYLLDERNFALGAIHRDAKGNVLWKESFQRDAVGHVIEANYTSADGKALGKRVFSYRGEKASFEDYDAAGNRIAPNQPVSQARPDKHRTTTSQ